MCSVYSQVSIYAYTMYNKSYWKPKAQHQGQMSYGTICFFI